MPTWLLALVVSASAGVAFRLWYRHWKRQRIAARRVVEKPNSHYSSVIVRNQIDRARWGKVDLEKIHPVNREEVERLLAVADVQGPEALSPRERLFLETMTQLSFG